MGHARLLPALHLQGDLELMETGDTPVFHTRLGEVDPSRVIREVAEELVRTL